METLERPARILIIEDNPADVMLLKLALRESGCSARISVCLDGDLAMAHVRSGEEPSEAVILDLNVPPRDGLEILGALRESPRWTSATVLVLTASALGDHREQVVRLGAEFRNKPCSYSGYLDVAAHIATVLAHRDGFSTPVSACVPNPA